MTPEQQEIKTLYNNGLANNDLAIQYSLDNRDAFNMQIVLRAHGLDHGLDDAIFALNTMQALKDGTL
jgi:hypothetical protein